MAKKPEGPLKRGWTTGACATAATKAAYQALLTGQFPDPVTITLPKGETPAFALAREDLSDGCAEAGVIKDAGDDPDVTHGALVLSRVRHGVEGSGVTFKAGTGVGMVTRPGLPIPPGEPAINPVPRSLMTGVIENLAEEHGHSGDVEIEISIPTGEKLAEKTWNPRLGILGGLSILGTTGVVVPFSCAAWIHSIHRGIDVARAEGRDHVAGSTGSTSEKAVQQALDLPLTALLDMGDFVGGMLKYLRQNPVPKATIAGGFAKLSKLAQGHMDLHSGRSQVDFDWLSGVISEDGLGANLAEQALGANTAMEVLQMAGDRAPDLALSVARRAQTEARRILKDAPISVGIFVVDRKGNCLAHLPA
ncbi:cobalt-precorrin-5B (C(1))-methyltransferase [Coralliovum pocilloporae]|uniref:cobalt-precorrin-5B (C(1))-methyltransferase n=1 Tax=Coralliovum pocilloporae TaxID=3066369 RepID=UPI0033076139